MPKVKFVQIAACEEGYANVPLLFALSKDGKIYTWCRGKWSKVESPNEE